MKKKLLPFSYLVLYAKHWIHFPNVNYENKTEAFWKELKYILYMCEYMPANKKDCIMLLSKAVDEINKVFKEDGKSSIYSLSSLFNIVDGIDKWQSYYYGEDIDYKTALAYHILSSLSMIDIRDYAVGYVDYKKYKCKNKQNIIGQTYKECQTAFNKTFADMLIEESYIADKYVISNFKQYIK